MMRNIIYSILFAGFLASLIALAATPGDKAPAGKNGVIQCPADGGTALIPLLPNQNAVAVRNFLGDGGTAQTIYVGFDSNASVAAGFPVKDQETLSIDVVAQSQKALSSGSDSLTDGGVTMSTGTMAPVLKCTAGITGGSQDLRFIMVK